MIAKEYTKLVVNECCDEIIGDLTALVGVGMNLGGADGEIYAEAVQECIKAVEKRREVLING